MAKALEQFTRESAAQIDQKQTQIRGQLEELRDNRAQRYYFQADSQKLKSDESRSQVEVQIQQQAPVTEPTDEYDADSAYGMVNGRRGSRLRQREGQVITPELRLGMESRVAGRPRGPGRPSVPAAASAGESLYTAKGTYSLPVTLPEGEIRLDFYRPAGQAELSLWAVSQGTMRKLYGTIALMVGLLVIAGLAKVWPRPQTRQPISAKYIVLYIALLVILTFVLGLVGLFISLVVILYSEAKRGAFIHPTPIEI